MTRRKVLIAAAVVLGLVIFLAVVPPPTLLDRHEIETLAEDLNLARVERIVEKPRHLEVRLQTGERYEVPRRRGTDWRQQVVEAGADPLSVPVESASASLSERVWDGIGLVINVLPLLLIFGLGFFLLRRATRRSATP